MILSSKKGKVTKCSLCGAERVTCPSCGHKWLHRGKTDSTRCGKCKSWFKLEKPKEKITDKELINNLVQGKIMDIVEKEGINPFRKNKFLRDSILHILGNDALVLALNKACDKRKRKPEEIIRKAVKKYLDEGGFFEC